jgi:hypothetical protein
VTRSGSTDATDQLSVKDFLSCFTTWFMMTSSMSVVSRGTSNHDGYADVIAFYDDGSNRTAVQIFRGNPNGVDPPVMIWDSGVGNWSWSNM